MANKIKSYDFNSSNRYLSTFSKRNSNNPLKLKVMTQKEIKALASEIVGDGQLPNKFFVTVSPYITTIDEFGDHNSELIDGYTDEDTTIEVFDTYEEAEEYFNTIDLDHRYGTGHAMIEDRLTGQITEIFLESVVEVNYHLRGHDMSKTFGYKK